MTIRCLFLTSIMVLAGEHTVKKGDVIKTLDLDVSILPKNAVPIHLSTETWTDLKITTHKTHGEQVTEGEVLISLKKKPLENTITDLKDEITLMTQELDLMKKKLADKEALAPLALKKLEEDMTRAKEDHTYYLETLVPQQKKSYDKFIEKAEWGVKSTSEELRQLKLMYEEDEITEDTEEIILERSKHMAENAKYQLEKAKEEFGHLKNVRLPRNIVDKNLQQEKNAYSYEEQKRTIPFEVEKLRLGVGKNERALLRKQERLEKLEKDLTQMEILSPATGVFFYGLLKDGGWTGATTTEKFMKKGGLIPTDKEFACIIPDGAETLAYAQVESKTLGALKAGLSGIMTLQNQEENAHPITCLSLSSTPLTNQKFLASFSLPSEATFPYTTTGKTKLLVTEKNEVLRIPKMAIKLRPDGSTTVSLIPKKKKEEQPTPDEETQNITGEDTTPPQESGAAEEGEKKPSPPKKKLNPKNVTVQLGLYGNDYVEVISGLKEGDVIQTP